LRGGGRGEGELVASDEPIERGSHSNDGEEVRKFYARLAGPVRMHRVIRERAVVAKKKSSGKGKNKEGSKEGRYMCLLTAPPSS